MSSGSNAPAEAYLALRDLFLTGAQAAMGLAPTKALPDVWAMLVEVGFEPGTAALVMVADEHHHPLHQRRWRDHRRGRGRARC